MQASFRVRKAEITNIMLMVVGLLVAGFMLVVTASEFGWNVKKDMETLARQNAKEIASEVSAISVAEQGVRFYEFGPDFTVRLEKNAVEVSYSDAKGKAFSYKFPHTAENVREASVSGAKRICISKALDGCVPSVTLCSENGPCCNLEKSTCFFAG